MDTLVLSFLLWITKWTILTVSQYERWAAVTRLPWCYVSIIVTYHIYHMERLLEIVSMALRYICASFCPCMGIRSHLPLAVHLMALLQEKCLNFAASFRHMFCINAIQFISVAWQRSWVFEALFAWMYQSKSGGGGGGYLLKDAVPTEFEWTTPALKRKPPKKHLLLPKTSKKASQQAQASVEIESASSDICEEQDASV